MGRTASHRTETTIAPDAPSVWRANSGFIVVKEKRNMRKTPLVALVLCVLLMCSGGSFAYSVLTHEEIVDLLWKDEIRPLLLKRFPALTEDQIREAHAYAYGGAVIQDL